MGPFWTRSTVSQWSDQKNDQKQVYRNISNGMYGSNDRQGVTPIAMLEPYLSTKYLIKQFTLMMTPLSYHPGYTVMIPVHAMQLHGTVTDIIDTKSAYKTFSEGLWTRLHTRNTCAREETKIDLWT